MGVMNKMGSFNNTCAVTQAPIRCGDKVKIMFLAGTYRNEVGEGFLCDPNDLCNVIAFPLTATYIDCSSYDCSMEKPEILEFFIDYLKKYCIVLDNKDNITLSDIFRMIHRGELKIKLPYKIDDNESSYVSLMAVHEGMYDLMVNNPATDYGKIDKTYKQVYDDSIKLLDEYSDDAVESYLNDIKLMNTIFNYSNVPIYDYRSFVTNICCSNLSTELRNAIIFKLSQMNSFNISMNTYRKMYVPMMTALSYSSLSSHINNMEQMIAVLKKINSESDNSED